MEITLEEKIKRVIAIIDEALTVQKTNPVYVPIAHFSKEALGFVNARDVFRILRESGATKKIKGWWGHDIIGDDKKERFVKTDSDESQTDEDYQVYEIEVDERKFSQFGSRKRTSINDVEFDSQNGTISFGKIIYAFQRNRKGQLRLKLFRALWNERKIVKGGKIRPKGEPFPPSAIAVQIGLTESPRDYDRDTEVKDKLDAVIKNVERSLQDKKLPIRIYKKGGIQIVIEIK